MNELVRRYKAARNGFCGRLQNRVPMGDVYEASSTAPQRLYPQARQPVHC